MPYALADIILFLLLLAGLWFALYRLYVWWATRGERREKDDIIRQIEDGMNKPRRR